MNRVILLLLLKTVLLLGFSLTFTSCVTPHKQRPAVNNVVATNVSIVNVAASAELVPAAIIARVRPKQQKITLLAYSEYGRQCGVLGINGHTTDSNVPNTCSDCGDSCPAKEVTGEKLIAFAKTPFQKNNTLPLPSQHFSPVVGVKNVPVNRVSRAGRYISSRSPDTHSGNLAAACFGPSGKCISTSNVRLAMAFDPLTTMTTTDAKPSFFENFSTFPSLAHHGGAHVGGFSRRGTSGGSLDPLVSIIAKAAGRPIRRFPAQVTLQSGLGSSFFESISRLGIAETVYQGSLKNNDNNLVPLWHIRLLFGMQVNAQGFRVEVSSANNLKWVNGNDDQQTNKPLSDNDVARIIENQLQMSINPNTGDAAAQLTPKQGNYIPLDYVIALAEDAEYTESVQTTVIEENVKEMTCKEID